MSATNGFSRHVQVVSTNGTATCPTCESPITQQQYERILKIGDARQKQLADERAVIERAREQIAKDRSNIAQAAVRAEREKWEAEAACAEREAERARKQVEAEKERMVRAHEMAMKAEGRKHEAEQKKVARELAAAQTKAKAEAEARVRDEKRAIEEKHVRLISDLRDQLKTLEQRRRRDEDSLKATISELQQKANVRDQLHFGPEGEEELMAALREQFPEDRVEHHGKIGDVIHHIMDGGNVAGTIVFEVKNRKSWDRAYIQQLKLAMESHGGTRHGILVSRTLPARAAGMCVVGGVIAVTPAIATQVVAVIRDGIITISRLRLSEDRKVAKTNALFEYVRSEDFSNAIRRVQEKIATMRETLNREKSHHDTWWTTREQAYAGILREASGIDARVNELLGVGTGDPHRAKTALGTGGSI